MAKGKKQNKGNQGKFAPKGGMVRMPDGSGMMKASVKTPTKKGKGCS